MFYFLYFQLNRFKRKRKAPVLRKDNIKIKKKDETAAAESLLELSFSNCQEQDVASNENGSNVSLQIAIFVLYFLNR